MAKLKATPKVIRLHDTQIVKFWVDGRITLHTGGYRTVTTKERINQFVSGRLYQRDYAWYYQDFAHGLVCRERCFADGMDVAVI